MIELIIFTPRDSGPENTVTLRVPPHKGESQEWDWLIEPGPAGGSVNDHFR